MNPFPDEPQVRSAIIWTILGTSFVYSVGRFGQRPSSSETCDVFLLAAMSLWTILSFGFIITLISKPFSVLDDPDSWKPEFRRMRARDLPALKQIYNKQQVTDPGKTRVNRMLGLYDQPRRWDWQTYRDKNTSAGILFSFIVYLGFSFGSAVWEFVNNRDLCPGGACPGSLTPAFTFAHSKEIFFACIMIGISLYLFMVAPTDELEFRTRRRNALIASSKYTLDKTIVSLDNFGDLTSEELSIKGLCMSCCLCIMVIPLVVVALAVFSPFPFAAHFMLHYSLAALIVAFGLLISIAIWKYLYSSTSSLVPSPVGQFTTPMLITISLVMQLFYLAFYGVAHLEPNALLWRGTVTSLAWSTAIAQFLQCVDLGFLDRIGVLADNVSGYGSSSSASSSASSSSSAVYETSSLRLLPTDSSSSSSSQPAAI